MLTGTLESSDATLHLWFSKGIRLRLNCQIMDCWLRKSLNFSSLCTFFNHLAAATKVFPLSEYTVDGRPRLAMSHFRLWMYSFVSRLDSSSKNTPGVRLQL